ncbi:P-loop containing nucleoside triphosphate hydrolase [Pseudocohnilembus persalinus]|uniref:p-loop containing nucleoside triphosphate hydrolase n=1 Tax=Pseudocohnilembus persalinus TaxID=266149 RepID=A0A0V0R5Y0_PSEPJ|nr:P-loop containing nucleoside triphosphate hydrolase [Pseudocohnilembus persalinus]|eukprot:KRX09621.1 P-loop containing nucleoside triphosphate hydrolase [Pseudocohnilembus persalinus]
MNQQDREISNCLANVDNSFNFSSLTLCKIADNELYQIYRISKQFYENGFFDKDQHDGNKKDIFDFIYHNYYETGYEIISNLLKERLFIYLDIFIETLKTELQIFLQVDEYYYDLDKNKDAILLKCHNIIQLFENPEYIMEKTVQFQYELQLYKKENFDISWFLKQIKLARNFNSQKYQNIFKYLYEQIYNFNEEKLLQKRDGIIKNDSESQIIYAQFLEIAEKVSPLIDYDFQLHRIKIQYYYDEILDYLNQSHISYYSKQEKSKFYTVCNAINNILVDLKKDHKYSKNIFDAVDHIFIKYIGQIKIILHNKQFDNKIFEKVYEKILVIIEFYLKGFNNRSIEGFILVIQKENFIDKSITLITQLLVNQQKIVEQRQNRIQNYIKTKEFQKFSDEEPNQLLILGVFFIQLVLYDQETYNAFQKNTQNKGQIQSFYNIIKKCYIEIFEDLNNLMNDYQYRDPIILQLILGQIFYMNNVIVFIKMCNFQSNIVKNQKYSDMVDFGNQLNELKNQIFTYEQIREKIEEEIEKTFSEIKEFFNNDDDSQNKETQGQDEQQKWAYEKIELNILRINNFYDANLIDKNVLIKHKKDFEVLLDNLFEEMQKNYREKRFVILEYQINKIEFCEQLKFTNYETNYFEQIQDQMYEYFNHEQINKGLTIVNLNLSSQKKLVRLISFWLKKIQFIGEISTYILKKDIKVHYFYELAFQCIQQFFIKLQETQNEQVFDALELLRDYLLGEIEDEKFEKIEEISDLDFSNNKNDFADKYSTLQELISYKSDVFQNMGKVVFDKQRIFKSLKNLLYREKYINNSDINQIIGKFEQYYDMKQVKIDIQKLRQQYDEVENKYKVLQKKYYNDQIEQNVELIVKETKSQKNQKLTDILGNIFAVWSFMEMKKEDFKTGKPIPRYPNPNQILTIILMVNYGVNQQQISNHVQQIKTGEGKSVIMGVLSTLFALQGKKVTSVCYSLYLSQRDEEDFKELFEMFQVRDIIEYTTFPQLCKNLLVDRYDIKNNTLKLLNNQKNQQNAQIQQNSIQSQQNGLFGQQNGINGQQNGLFGQQSVINGQQNGLFGQQNYINGLQTGLNLQNTQLINNPINNMNINNNNSNSNSNQIYNGGQIIKKSENEAKDKVLICDEIDVFFSKDFYGQRYNQLVLYQNEQISYLVKEIWNCKKNYRHFNEEQIYQIIQRKEQYQNLEKTFKDNYVLDYLFAQEIKKLCKFVCKFDEHKNTYTVQKGEIKYKLTDHSNTGSFIQPYLTQFAYIYESQNQPNLISEQNVSEHLGLYLTCGFIAYAKIFEFFEKIYGVTGTLKEISNDMEIILNDQFDIKLKTYTPSIFQDKRLKFSTQDQNHFEIFFNQQQQFNAIMKQTIKYQNRDQSILIFFEEDTQKNKENKIKQSTCKQKVTLLIREYGRGTDFICDSKTVQKQGGVVVIQTFFSDDYAEEVQIKGRTARAGQKGEYLLYLNDQILKDQFKDVQIQQNNQTDRYQCLNELRQIKFKSQIQQLEKKQSESKKAHELSLKYTENLTKNQKSAQELLLQINQGEASNFVHAIFILDNSGSMAGQGWRELSQAVDQALNTLQKQSPNHVVSIIFYNSFGSIIVNQLKIKSAIQEWERNKSIRQGGGTDFDQGFSRAIEILQNQQNRQLKKMILFLTDGYGCYTNQRLEQIQQYGGNELVKFQCQGMGEADVLKLQDIANIMNKNKCKASVQSALTFEDLQKQFQSFVSVEGGFI